MFARLPAVALILAAACSGPTPAPAPASAGAPSAPPVAVPAPTAGGVDPCLLGAWRLTPENAMAQYQRVLGAAGTPVTIRSVTGLSTLTFSRDGGAAIQLADVTVGYDVAAGGTPMAMKVIISGTGSARYRADGQAADFTEASTNLTGELKMTMAGTERTVPWSQGLNQAFDGVLRTRSRYTCDAERLVLTAEVEGAAPVVWIR